MLMAADPAKRQRRINARLVTRCGCTSTVTVTEPPPPTIQIPLIDPEPVSPRKPDEPKGMQMETRVFLLQRLDYRSTVSKAIYREIRT